MRTRSKCYLAVLSLLNALGSTVMPPEVLRTAAGRAGVADGTESDAESVSTIAATVP